MFYVSPVARQKLIETVRALNNVDAGSKGLGLARPDSWVEFVLVTDAGNSLGRISKYDAVADTWINYTEDVAIYDIGGGSLTENQRYIAVGFGKDGAGHHVFFCQQAGSGGGGVQPSNFRLSLTTDCHLKLEWDVGDDTFDTTVDLCLCNCDALLASGVLTFPGGFEYSGSCQHPGPESWTLDLTGFVGECCELLNLGEVELEYQETIDDLVIWNLPEQTFTGGTLVGTLGLGYDGGVNASLTLIAYFDDPCEEMTFDFASSSWDYCDTPLVLTRLEQSGDCIDNVQLVVSGFSGSQSEDTETGCPGIADASVLNDTYDIPLSFSSSGYNYYQTTTAWGEILVAINPLTHHVEVHFISEHEECGNMFVYAADDWDCSSSLQEIPIDVVGFDEVSYPSTVSVACCPGGESCGPETLLLTYDGECCGGGEADLMTTEEGDTLTTEEGDYLEL